MIDQDREENQTTNQPKSRPAESKRERVRANLIRPLTEIGLRRPARRSIAEHDAMLVRLADKLAYLDADQLAMLCETIGANPAGADLNRWPDEVIICKWAGRIAPQPPEQSRLVVSWMASAAGCAALDGDYAVELMRDLIRSKIPPGAWAMTRIRAAADERRAERGRIERLIEDGRARPSDVETLARIRAAEARARTMVIGEAATGAGAAA